MNDIGVFGFCALSRPGVLIVRASGGQAVVAGREDDVVIRDDAGADLHASLLGGGHDAPGGEAGPLGGVAQYAKDAHDGNECRRDHDQHRLDPARVTRKQGPRAGEIPVRAEALELGVVHPGPLSDRSVFT